MKVGTYGHFSRKMCSIRKIRHRFDFSYLETFSFWLYSDHFRNVIFSKKVSLYDLYQRYLSSFMIFCFYLVRAWGTKIFFSFLKKVFIFKFLNLQPFFSTKNFSIGSWIVFLLDLIGKWGTKHRMRAGDYTLRWICKIMCILVFPTSLK